MLGSALLPFAHPIPHAPEHLGASRAISDGLWRCPLYLRVWCVDGSELARTFFTLAALVGAPVCSAFRCGSHDRWP
jgi:hypothetical protein